MTKVLDAHGLLVFLEKEAGFKKVEQLLVSAAEKDKYLLMSAVNFGEVYYIVLRECGTEKAAEIEKIIKTLPVKIVGADEQIAKEAARLKALGRKISYADCFAAALAKLHKGEVITGDKEFKAVKGEVKISWIR